MSIRKITQNEKHEVLIRLLMSNENFDSACSKSGLSLQTAKNLLAK